MDCLIRSVLRVLFFVIDAVCFICVIRRNDVLKNGVYP